VSTCAIGGSYATVANLKVRLGIPDTNTTQDTLLATILASVSRDIDRFCGRQFGRDEAASARTYYPGRSGIDIDDAWDLTGATVTPYVAGTAGTTYTYPWTILRAEPLNGIRDGLPGWPWQRLANVDPLGVTALAYLWPGVTTVQVSAKWGWQAIPDNVVEACLLLAVSGARAKDAPFGVASFGDYAVRLRQNPMAAEKLEPYRRDNTLLVGS
jgi:hypothetical protein